MNTIVFCLPGNSFSGKFLDSWSSLLAACISNGIRPIISRKSSCNIYYVRNMCLGDVFQDIVNKAVSGHREHFISRINP